MLQIKFDTDNAAFDGEDLTGEVARILRQLADKIENQEFSGKFQPVRDINGNAIGAYKLC